MPSADHDISRWDSLIQNAVRRFGRGFRWQLTKAQVMVESSGDAWAVSPAGAVGLMQVMPLTFAECVPDEYKGRPANDPEANLAAGVSYFSDQLAHFPEIIDARERIPFAIASYNCGRGYVNAAMRLARATPAGDQIWNAVAPFLFQATVAGRQCRASETVNYVQRVLSWYAAFGID